jgi:hypothetical protein
MKQHKYSAADWTAVTNTAAMPRDRSPNRRVWGWPVLGPLVAAHLANDAGNFGPALIAASAVVALGGLLMPAVGLLGTTSTESRREYVHVNRH